MALKKRSSLPHDAAKSSRQPKKLKAASCSSGNITDSSRLELNAINHKIQQLETRVQKMEELQREMNELKEKLNRMQNPIDTNQMRSGSEEVDHGQYELRFHGAVKKRVYTGSKVEAQHGELLKVTIYCNGEKITSGPLASAKFETLVVEGDFCASSQGGWSADAFKESIVDAREEVGPILKSGYLSEFANGEAVLDGLVFMDNSSWVKGKKWRLGIRLLESNGVRVLEAISSCIRVLDRHGKGSEKPHPPLLTHGVDCLEKVGMKRASDLKKKKIFTITDFLQLFHRKPSRLLQVLCIKSESDESWKTMIRHAKECDVGSNLYSHRKNNSVLFFNSVYELVGAEFGNHYRSYEKLQDSKKILVDKWKKGFYKNIKLRDLTADFEMVNGQPVPIEYDFTGISTDAVAPQYGEYYHPTSLTPYNYVPQDTETDADQNPGPDHNTDEHDKLIQAGVHETQPIGDHNIPGEGSQQGIGTETTNADQISRDYPYSQADSEAEFQQYIMELCIPDPIFYIDEQLLGTGTGADLNAGPSECSLDSQHAPPQPQQRTKLFSAKKAYSRLRGCTVLLLLFNHVRRERPVG